MVGDGDDGVGDDAVGSKMLMWLMMWLGDGC